MRAENRIITAGAIVLLCLPMLAKAIPLSYSFTGQLTAFGADDGVTQRTIESLGSRSITGTVSYDTDRQDVSAIIDLLRIAFSGDNFSFDAGFAGIEGAQSIYREDTASLDSISFFEFYEYMLPESMDTLTTTLELHGDDLLNPDIGAANSMIDPTQLQYGSGLFDSTRWDYGESVTRLHGAFDVTSISLAATSVPEPDSVALLGTALLLFALAHRHRRRRSVRARD
jgi:PEP-CTERM motif